MGILDMLMGGGGGANGFQQMIGYAPAKSGMGSLGGGGLQGFLKQDNVQDLLKQLMQPQGGAQGSGGQSAAAATPAGPRNAVSGAACHDHAVSAAAKAVSHGAP